MKKIITLIFLSTTVVFTQCTPKKAATAGMSDAEKVADVKKNFTEAQMQEGKTIWQGSCDKCHKLYEPESRSIDKWERVLPRMTNRAKLDDAQGAKVRAYLIAHAKMD
jgi:Dihaem cytochrome c.